MMLKNIDMKLNSCSYKRWKLGEHCVLLKYDGTVHEVNIEIIDVYLLTKDCFKLAFIFSMELNNEKYLKSDLNNEIRAIDNLKDPKLS